MFDNYSVINHIFAFTKTLGRRFRNTINRIKLKNRSFSIISSNCNGGVIAHDLGVKFNTPFINVGFLSDDYIKLLQSPKHYLYDCELEFIKPVIDGCYIITGDEKYTVAKLDDITLFFAHNQSESQARDNWNRRKKRINWDNLFIVFTDRDNCSYSTIAAFDALPYKNKVIFTNREYPEFSSAYYIRGFENDESVGILSEYIGHFGKRYLDCFDYVKWLNNGHRI